MPSHTDTAHTSDVLAGMKRRREYSYRLPPLDCGCHDPASGRHYRHHDGPQAEQMTERVLDAWSAAAHHLLGAGLLPIVPVEVRRKLRRRGGADRALARRLHRACPERAA